jgi:hypothetical protein
MGTVDSVKGKQTGSISFTIDVTPGDQSLPLLTACGYRLDTGTYKPTSNMSNRKTWTFNVWEDGTLKKLSGVALDATIEGENGKKLTIKFTGKGVWKGVTDASMPSQAPIQAQPYVCMATTLTIGAAAIAHTSKVTVKLGAQVEEREAIAGSGTVGLAHCLVGEREPLIDLDPEARTVAQHDAYGLLLTGTTAAFSWALVSGDYTLTIAAPRVQRTEVKDEMRGKRRTHPITLQCNASSGDDELTFAEVDANP